METEISCKVIDPNDVSLPLKDGEMLVSDIIELGPHKTAFDKPVTVQMQYSRSPAGGDVEPVMWVTDDMSQWTELETTTKGDGDLAVSVDHFSTFAVISQPKQDQFSVSTEGASLTSSTQPGVQITFPEKAVATPVEVKVQVQEISKSEVEDVKARDQASRGLVSTSPIVEVEAVADSILKFNKPVTVRVPHPQHYMDVLHEGPAKLRVMSCEEGTDDWIDTTDSTNIRVTQEAVEFEVTHFTRWISIVVERIYDDQEDLGPIPLHLCRWLQSCSVQFMLLQREDNPNEVVIECAPARRVKKTFQSRKREGYKGSLPTGSVNLFEGQKVEVVLQGNVSLGPGSRMKQHMTFHSTKDNRVHMHVVAMASKDEKGPEGIGSVWFYAVPRVEIVESRALKVKRSVRKNQQPCPEEPPESQYLCELPIYVPHKIPQKDVSKRPDEDVISTGVGVYFQFIKEHVATDWKDLAIFLGYEGPDITNIAGRNNDDKSRCLDMLWEWRKKTGIAATIKALMEALSKANLQNVADGLREKYPEIDC
ncbi:p53-induced death domain-containing protein 1-like [Branchiostoma lanceolatum]|uniref:p53-induced death domain-containing protein 1-like n=1 Tax=Branchiostoma lanceolatum TaxID=7740 RepID=UPI003453B653